ncbi:hypothetical protein Lser_V15G27182 [Lactuca serriola]
MTPPSPFTGSLSIDLGYGFVFGGALGSPGGSFQPEKPSTVDEMGTSSHSFSFEAYAPAWTITRDSLLSEDITAQEWRSCAHPSTTMNSLAGQLSARMASDLYVAAQASTLMVNAVDWVFRAGVNETQLKTFQGAMASITEELRDSEVECRVFSEQNCIVACDKAVLEDHVATLEVQTERHESQVSSLTREKGVLASELARFQCQMVRTHVDSVVARGSLQCMLEKGVVRIIDKVIENAKFSNGIQGLRKVCEALGFEKGKQLGGCSTISGESEASDPGRAERRAVEVDIALTSLAETDFAGLFRLGELDYDSFRRFCRRSGLGSSSLDSKD